MLLFTDGEEWSTVRKAIVTRLTQDSCWSARVPDLPKILAKFAPTPCNLSTITKPVTDKMVAAGVWYLLFGVELTEEQAAVCAQWGGSGKAGYFVFPRFIHRLAFNLLLKAVIQLRKDTLAVFSAHNLRPVAAEINDACGQYKRSSVVAMADELMFAVNFAGVGGTQHATFGTISFMQKKTIDVKAQHVKFPEGSMVDMYKANKVAFIKECARLDAPVTSATCTFTEPKTVSFNVSCCGGASPHDFATGRLHQYVLSIANRDPTKFDNPDAFDSARSNLDDMLGWNGAISGGEAEYPRFCPGFKISLAVIQAVVGLLDDVKATDA